MRPIPALCSAVLVCSVTVTPALAAQGSTDKDKASEATSTEAVSTSHGLSIGKAVICKNFGRNGTSEEGTTFSPDIQRLYCVTQIKGAKDSVKVQHRWYNGDNLVFSLSLPVKSADWRTQSCINIWPSTNPDWRVDVVVLPEQEVLTTLKFTIK
jgi:hypothetical protein